MNNITNIPLNNNTSIMILKFNEVKYNYIFKQKIGNIGIKLTIQYKHILPYVT